MRSNQTVPHRRLVRRNLPRCARPFSQGALMALMARGIGPDDRRAARCHGAKGRAMIMIANGRKAPGNLAWATHGSTLGLAVVLGLALLAGCAEPSLAPPASQSACPDTMSDADRLACLISIEPEPAPALRKPSPLLRNSEDTI